MKVSTDIKFSILNQYFSRLMNLEGDSNYSLELQKPQYFTFIPHIALYKIFPDRLTKEIQKSIQ